MAVVVTKVAGIKREYDKLQRKHNKHVREMDREKSKNSAAAHDSASDLLRLNQKIQVRPTEAKMIMIKKSGFVYLFYFFCCQNC